MKRSILILTLAACSLCNTTRPMYPEGLPTEIKAYVVAMLQGHSIETIIKGLIALKRTNKEFYDIISYLPAVQPFLQLDSLIQSDNIFAVFDFLQQHPALLQYQDLALYLNKIFYYLPVGTINTGLQLLDPVQAAQRKQLLHESINSLLFKAVEKNNIHDALQYLVLGANPNTIGISGSEHSSQTALSTAIFNQNIIILKLLLDASANVEDTGSEEKTPLEIAVIKNDVDSARILLAYDANPNVLGRRIQISPIIRAAYHKNTDMIDLLIEHGADVSQNTLDLLKNNIMRMPETSGKKTLLNAMQFLENYLQASQSKDV